MVDIRGTTQVTGGKIGLDEEEEELEAAMLAGELDGENVVWDPDPVQIAKEVLTELGRVVSEQIQDELGREERRAEHADGKVSAVAGSKQAEGDPAELVDLLERKADIEALGASLKALNLEDPEEVIRHLRDNLGERPGEPGPNHDPTLQYGALAVLERNFAAAGDSEMAARMRAAADKLLAENGSHINKGMVATEAAALYASERFGSVSQLRSLYVDQVFEQKGIPASFNAIMEKHGEAGFSDAVAFLLRAAGADLATMSSNNDRAQQKEVLDNLYQLEVLNTVRERTDEVLQRLGKHFPLAPDAVAQGIMRDTFGMIENPVRMSEQNVTKLAKGIVPDSIEGRISFLRDYRSLAGLIPLKVFDEADRGAGGGLRLRERLGEAIMAAQDAADAEEQEKLASQ